jgi:hypothetical protein
VTGARAALAVALFAAAAAAGDRIVVVKASSGPDYGPFRGTPGSIVVVDGDGFAAKESEVAVALDGRACTVTAAVTTRVTFALPDGAKFGKHEVTIAAGGRSTRFALELVARAFRPDGDPPPSTPIVIHSLRILDDPPRFEVSGEAALPEKSELQLELGFKFPRGALTQEQSLASIQTSVSRKTFAARFGPFRDRRLLAGHYFVVVRARDELVERRFEPFDDAGRANVERDFRDHHVEVARTVERFVHDLDKDLAKEQALRILRDLAREQGRRRNVTLGEVDPEAERLAEGLILGAAELARRKLAIDLADHGAFDGWARALGRAEIAPALAKLRARLVP